MKALTLILLSAALCGCMSERDAREFRKAFAEPFQKAAKGGYELEYTSRSFLRKHDRWPKDYEELSKFVQQSNGLLELRKFERVDFTQLADGKLEIAYVPSGQTNQSSVTIGQPIQK